MSEAVIPCAKGDRQQQEKLEREPAPDAALALRKARSWPPEPPQWSAGNPAGLHYLIHDLHKCSEGKATRFATDKARRDG